MHNNIETFKNTASKLEPCQKSCAFHFIGDMKQQKKLTRQSIYKYCLDFVFSRTAHYLSLIDSLYRRIKYLINPGIDYPRTFSPNVFMSIEVSHLI